MSIWSNGGGFHSFHKFIKDKNYGQSTCMFQTRSNTVVHPTFSHYVTIFCSLCIKWLHHNFKLVFNLHLTQGNKKNDKTLETVSTENTLFSDDMHINPLVPNDVYISRTTQLTSRCCILNIYSTNIFTEYFKHAAHSPLFSLQDAVYFIMLSFLVPVIFTF